MFLVRAKVRELVLREGDGAMRKVGPRSWEVFERLPHGILPPGDGDFEVRTPQCDADVNAALAENERNAAADKALREAEAGRRAEKRQRVIRGQIAELQARSPRLIGEKQRAEAIAKLEAELGGSPAPQPMADEDTGGKPKSRGKHR